MKIMKIQGENKNSAFLKTDHDENVLQSKKVKLVETKSGPSAILTDSLDVKWCSVDEISGSKSLRGVVQLTPLAVLERQMRRKLND